LTLKIKARLLGVPGFESMDVDTLKKRVENLEQIALEEEAA